LTKAERQKPVGWYAQALPFIWTAIILLGVVIVLAQCVGPGFFHSPYGSAGRNCETRRSC